MSFRLKTVLIMTFVIVSLLLTTSLSWVLNKKSADTVRTEVGQSLMGMANHMADKLDNFMWSRSGEVDLLGNLVASQGKPDPDQVRSMINQLQTSFPSFSWVGFTDPQGKVLAATGRILEGKSLAERPVYLEGIKGKFIGDVHDAVLLASLLPNPTGEPLQFVDISIPVKDQEGTLYGVLAAHMSWAWADEVQKTVMEPEAARSESVEMFIVSKNDQTILLGPRSMVGMPLQLPSLETTKRAKDGWAVETWPDGKSYLTGFAYGDGYLDYPGLGWTVVVRQPEPEAFSSVTSLLRFNLLAGGAAVLLFALIGWVLAARISLPIRTLTRHANQLKEGEIREIPQTGGFQEISTLSRSLREMVEAVSKKETELGIMQNLAHSDQLTGLPNRIALESYLEKAITTVDADGHTLTFLYIDLDGFKLVNDTRGHQTGDILLQKVAQRLVELLEEGDIAVRLGGDEFLIVMHTPREHQFEKAGRLAEQVIAAMNRPFVIDYQQVHIGCSIGGAVYPDHSLQFDEVLNLADEGLYRSKRAGKNTVYFYGRDFHL